MAFSWKGFTLGKRRATPVYIGDYPWSLHWRGEKRFGYEVAGSNKRETDGDVKVVFGIALYILVVCDRLCIAYIETRYLIVVEASCKP